VAGPEKETTRARAKKKLKKQKGSPGVVQRGRKLRRERDRKHLRKAPKCLRASGKDFLKGCPNGKRNVTHEKTGNWQCGAGVGKGGQKSKEGKFRYAQKKKKAHRGKNSPEKGGGTDVREVRGEKFRGNDEAERGGGVGKKAELEGRC